MQIHGVLPLPKMPKHSVRVRICPRDHDSPPAPMSGMHPRGSRTPGSPCPCFCRAVLPAPPPSRTASQPGWGREGGTPSQRKENEKEMRNNHLAPMGSERRFQAEHRERVEGGSSESQAHPAFHTTPTQRLPGIESITSNPYKLVNQFNWI